MSRSIPLLWGLSISLFALWLRFARLETYSVSLARLMGDERVHVVAHLLLYGTLALLARRFIGRRVPVVVGTVLAMGAIQELAQVVGARTPGWPELFDLAVDTAAALTVCGLAAGLERLRGGRVG